MKKAIVRLMFFFLGRGLIVLSRLDSRAKGELLSWPEGYVICLDATKGVKLLLEKRDGKLRKCTREPEPGNSVIIAFKCLDVAFMMVTAQLSTAMAQAEHRFTLRGDINQAMSVVRCLSLAERYLFPAFLAKKVLLRLDKKEVSSLRVYCGVLFSGR